MRSSAVSPAGRHRGHTKGLIEIKRVALTALLALATLFGSLALAANRIVTLSGDATEILFALGAGDQVVAVDATSNYPAAARDLPNLGYPGALGPEAVMAFEPTHVIASKITDRLPEELLGQLEALGVTVVRLDEDPTSATPANNIRRLAALTGQEAAGEELIAGLDAQFAEAAARASDFTKPPRVMFLYLGSRQMQFAGGAGTATHVLIEAAGAIDAGAEAGFVGNQPFTTEALVAAAPDVLLVTDRGLAALGGVEGVLEIPGVAQTPAGANGNIVSYEDLYLLGMGPRFGEMLLDFVDKLHQMQ